MFICGDISSNFSASLNKAYINGDGVSVSLIEYSDRTTKSYFDLGTDGKGLKYLVMPYGAFRKPTPEILDEP
ncbi:ketoacyl-ACP synthase III, partial [Campylobacter jejuni]|uniref:hypothetical protein n=1 Tax=Campylobacter jejuni TaxID=197 RepID=UPI001003B144